MRPLRIVVWDPSPSIRSLVRRILSGLTGIEILEGGSGPAGIASGEGPAPDLVILGADRQALSRGMLESWSVHEKLRIILLTPPGLLHHESGGPPPSTGRVSMLPKPSTPEGWERLGPQLASLVTHMLAAGGPPYAAVRAEIPSSGRGFPERRYRLAAIGASSGGPAALHSMLASLKGRVSPGLAVVQHITPGFEDELVQWLARDLEIDVAVAVDGEELLPGKVRIAPPDAHLRVVDGRILRLDRRGPPRNGHRPSVDELFFSIADHYLPYTVAILLDGMGRDGVEGLRRIREGGGMTVVQDPETCVVGGMPLAALREDAAMRVLPPSAIGGLLGESRRGRSVP